MSSISNIGYNQIQNTLGGESTTSKAGVGGQPNVGNGNMAARGLPSGLRALNELLGNASGDPLANVSRGSPQDVKGASAEDLKAKLQELSSGGAASGSLASLIGRLMIEMAQDQREQAMKDRAAAREAAQSELLSQAGQMQKAASEMLKGAIVNAVLGGIAAGVSGLSSIASFAKQGKELTKMNASVEDMKLGDVRMKELANGGKMTKAERLEFGELKAQHAVSANQFAIADKTSGRIQTAAGGIDQLAGAGKAAGASTDGAMQSEAKKAEAEGSKDAAQAEYMKQVSDGHQQVMDDMKNMMQQIINFIKEMQDAEVEAMRSITRA